MKYVYLALLVAIVTSSCNRSPKVDWEPGDLVEVAAQVQYKAQGVLYADVGAELFVFENLGNLEDYAVENEQLVNKKTGEIVKHTIQAAANEKGIATLLVAYGQTCIIVVQSAAYPSKYVGSVHHITNNQSQIGIGKIIFEE